MRNGLVFKFFQNLALVLVLSACATKASKMKKQQVELFSGAGTQSLMNGDYTDALTNLKKANELEPDNSGIVTNLGMAYYFKGERDLAVRTLKRALELDEKNSDARVNLASIYYNDGDHAGAEKIYKQVLKDLTYDKQARTLYNLGVLAVQKNNSVEAENYFNKSVKEDDSYCPSYFQLGLLHYGRKQYKSAHKNFRESTMGTCYSSPAGHFYQALSLTKLRRYTDARLKYDEIDAKFKKTEYAEKARAKMLELNDIEKTNPAEESHASRKVLESPEF